MGKVKEFFSGLFRKYPDRARRDGSEFRTVYGGPEYFRRQARKRQQPDDDPGIEEVYAGPAFWGVPDADPEEPEEEREEAGPDIPEMAPVYAGPEYWNGPVDREEEEREPFETVYAGPEYWDGPAGEPEQVPQEIPGPDETQMNFVYGGPQFLSQNERDQSLFMAVYAGPDYWNPSIKQQEVQGPTMMMLYAAPPFRPQPGAYAPGPEAREEAPEGTARCPWCGTYYPEDFKFCPECGGKNPKKDPEAADV